MKKKIAILGSTGSIGKSLLKIININKKYFEVKLLTARKNHKELLKQAIKFKVKNVILTNRKHFELYKSKFRSEKINIYNNYDCFEDVINKRLDYVMSSIVGIDGLIPTTKIIKHTKTIAIANKESIICAWNIIKNKMKTHGTKFIPVDSEHFSIWYALKNNSSYNVKKIYLTASGGPLLNISSKKFNKLNIEKIITHPNWKMGKKISVDSSTMMNKIFEVIEAKRIFNLNYEQISILIHPKSYLHAIIEFKDGMIKIIAHDTTMAIPIFNTLQNKKNKIKFVNFKNLNLKKMNNLDLRYVNKEKFPVTKLISYLPKKNTLFETVIVSANDALVDLFLRKKIKYTDITLILLKILKLKEFRKLKNIYPRNINEILKLSNYVRLKINSISV